MEKKLSSENNQLSSEQILGLLPHRYPFALVDKVIENIPGERAVAVKNVTINEPQFQGHFPERPLMPGVLIVDINIVFLEGVAAITESSLLKIIDLLISRKKLSGLAAFFIPAFSKSLTHSIADPSKRGISFPSTSICI